MDDTRFEPTTPDAARDSGLFDAWQMLADHHAGRIPDYPPPEPVALDRRAPSRAPWILAGAAVFFAFGATALAMTAITTARSAERDPARPDAPKVALARVNPPDAPVETAAPEHTPQPPIETTEDGATEAATDAPRPTPRPATRARRDPTPTPVAAEPEPQRAPAHSWQTGGGGGAPLDDDLDSLLDRALGDASPDPRPTARRTLPDTPTRRQVATTLRALEGDVRRCGGDGVADTRIVVAGDTGRVVGVSVGGDAAGTSAASCVADHVRSARFPRFSRERFTIRFPYALD